MIRLSKRAWNNVIIFAMLIMIVMFNMTNNILTGSVDSEERVPLLPENAVLMTLEFGSSKIERIGRGWCTDSDIVGNETVLGDITSGWQEANMISSAPFSIDNALVVVVWIAGEPKGLVYQLVEYQSGVGVMVENQYYLIQNEPLRRFVLPGEL